MTWQITYITWIHLITAIVCLQLVFTVYNIQQIRGREPFLWMMALAAFWSLILTFESSAPSIAEKSTLSQFEYFSNMGIPLMFLRFILSYDLDQPVWFKRYFWLLWIVPCTTILLVFTHFMHQLIWTGFSWSPAGHNILIYRHGPAFYIAMAYSVGLIFLANILLIRFIVRRPGYFKSRAWFLLSGSFVAIFTGLVYVLDISPVEGLDCSPMGCLVAGLIFFRGISREQLFDIVPFSHQFMIEKMKDGVIILDNRDFIMDISQAALNFLEIDHNVSGWKIDDVMPALLPVLTGSSVNHESRIELSLSPQQGWFEVNRYPLRGDRGQFLGNLLILHNINHRKEIELQLRQLAAELTDLNRMKDRIYSVISHDLRNPFNSIMGFSEILAVSYNEFTETERRRFAENIYIGSKSASNLLENLLQWSLMQLNQVDYKPEELQLSALVDETFSLMYLMVQEKKITLVNRVSPGQVVYADRHMMAAILRNLVSNAIKFTHAGGEIMVSSLVREGMVEVTVADNGIGMSREIIERLFTLDNMQTMPGTGDEKGTGLGLLLVKDFIEKNNGTIYVTSEPGAGSRFAFTVPEKKTA
ncbi:MAG: histidine kinase N-terminal 7TM domain-containing protein [Bacteroidota bacterium]